MLVYPGGRVGDRASLGYSFFTIFFCDLGQTQTHSGASNAPSLVLFLIALVTLAFGLPLFFFAFARLFERGSRGALIVRVAPPAAALSAICFLGVGATPWNLYLQAHNEFVTWAFRALLIAMLAALAASLSDRAFARTFGAVFGAYTLVLIGYVLLIALGPAPATAAGAAIQATGQKIIIYASILNIVTASFIARSILAR